MKKFVMLALAFLSVIISSPATYAGINFLAPVKTPDGLATFEQAQSAKSDVLDRAIEAKVASARKLAGNDDKKYVSLLQKLESQAKVLAKNATNSTDKAKKTYVYNTIEVARLFAVSRILPQEPRKLVEEYVAWNKANMHPESILAVLKNPNDTKASAIAKKETMDLMTKPTQFALDIYATSNKDNTILQKAINEVVERCRLDASKIDITLPEGKKYSEMRVAFFGIFQGKSDQEVKKSVDGLISMILRQGERGALKIPNALRAKQ